MNILSLNSNSGIISDEPFIVNNQFTEITILYDSNRGHSRLFKAKRLGKWLVLKTLKTEYQHNVLYQGLLHKEFQIAYPLSNPNIVQTIGFEDVPELGLCIIMEYIDGTSLRELLSQNKISNPTILSILNGLCEALEHIHSRQIIHRDLKPENIIITRNGANVKLIDFGLSDTDSYAILKQPAGTIGYTSPEQQISKSVIDNRSDIYSLGVILEEIINIKGIRIPNSKKIISQCKTDDRATRFSSVNAVKVLLQEDNRIKQYISSTIILAILIGGIFISYQRGVQNTLKAKGIPKSISTYEQLAIKSKSIATERCDNLYNKFDTITYYSSLLKWNQEYSDLVRTTNVEVDSLLKSNIDESQPEYNLYKTSLNSVVESVWMDFYYKNQKKIANISNLKMNN